MIANPKNRSTNARSPQAYSRTDGSAGVRGDGRLARTKSLVFAVGLTLACGDGEAALPPPPPVPTIDTEVGRVPLTPACVEGAVEPCHEMLGEHEGIVSCYEGTRTCVGGVFGACLDGESYQVVRSDSADGESDGSGLRPLAFSTASKCTNNPCNAYCREFNEAPDLGLAPEPDPLRPPLSTWITGDLSDYPPEWVVVGNREPCQVAGDCQFNTECTDPSFGSCSHSVCANGESLAPGCSRCTDTVCALNPDCCTVAPACAHDPCEAGSGAPLDRTCDTCVDAVCALHPECCDVSWNDACVAYVATECAPLGQACSCPSGSIEADGTCYVASDDARDWFSARDACGVYGFGWNLIAVDDEAENGVALGLANSNGFNDTWLGGLETGIDQWTWQSTGELFFVSDALGGLLQGTYTYENFADSEPELGVQGRGLAMEPDGEWHDAPLSFETSYICEGPKNRLGPPKSAYSWGPTCVALAARACGVSCAENAALGLGACTARVPTDLDETCPQFDLALGATCEAGGLPQVPVCNHGQVSAPAGLRLVHLPIGQIGNAAPDLGDAGDCVLSEAIPPGRCVSVTDCPGLTADRALLVNPVDGAQNAAECRFDDNWTIYQPLPCRAATCESGVYDAAQVRATDCSIELQNPLGVDPTLARVTVGTSVPEPDCGANEVRWGASCYFFSNDVETWDAAQDRCRGRGAGWDLVALNSPAEQAWVASLGDPSRDTQIGFNDKDIEGDHVWSNGSCRVYSNWDASSAQPNNTPPGSEQCARMTSAAGGAWEDTACNDGQHPFVCEGPVLDVRGGCASGQIAGPDGSCYSFERGGRSFDDARSSCQSMGPGWRLVVIDNATTNDFVTSLVNCTPTWLNNPPGAYAHWQPAESVDLSNPPFIDEVGFWHATPDGVLRATLCQGPPVATGAPVLTQVNDDTECTADDQFYFVGNALAPEKLVLCGGTCVAAASVPGRRIEVEIPCAPPAPPAAETLHEVIYGEVDPATGESLCPSSQPQWDFLYYDTVTPADSRIEFEIRTGATTAEFDANVSSFIRVGEAHAVPTDTQRCEVGPQGSGCPIDLFEALTDDGRAPQVPYLQLLVRLIPGTNGEGPVVRDWKVRFSCPPAQ